MQKYIIYELKQIQFREIKLICGILDLEVSVSG